MTGSDMPQWEEFHVGKFVDELLGEPLDHEHVRLVETKEQRQSVCLDDGTFEPYLLAASSKWKSSSERENTFAATLPLESSKYNLSQFQTRRRSPSPMPRGERNNFVPDVSLSFPSKVSTRAVHTAVGRGQQAWTLGKMVAKTVRNVRVLQHNCS